MSAAGMRGDAVNLAEALEFAQVFGVAGDHVATFLLLAGAVAVPEQAGLDIEDLFGLVTDPLGYQTVPLRLWADPREIDAANLVDLARRLDLSGRPIRLAFVGNVDDDLVEHLRTSLTDTTLRSWSRARLDGPPVRPLDWPIRIAVDTEFLRPLSEHQWAPNLIEQVDPLRIGSRPHIVAGSASWIRRWAAGAPERASLVVVLGRDPSPFELFELIARAAGGWAHFPGAEGNLVAEVANALIVELSHNRAVDEAIAWIGNHMVTGPGTLVAPPAWLAMSRLTGAIARAADAQDRLEVIDTTRRRRPVRRRETRRRPLRRQSGDPSLAVRFRDRHFQSEITDASDAAPALRNARQLNANREDRYLTADVTPGVGYERASGASLSVWIAPLEAVGAAVAPDRFVDEALPWNGVAIQLDVVLFELRDGGYATRRQIELPPRGASTKALFEIQWDGTFAARVVVLHDHRFVQSMLLTIAGGASRVSLDRECLIRPADSGLLDATPHGAAMVLNDHDGPLLGIATPAGEEITAPQGLDKLRESMTKLLADVIDDPDAFGSLAAPKYADLLVELAKRGITLRDSLFTGEATAVAPGIYEALRAATRISVFSAVPSHILPLEFVYEPPLHIPFGTTGSVCEHARTAFSQPSPDLPALQQACIHVGAGGTCGATASQVCPLGFWGLRKVIERHTNRTERGPIERDYAVSSSPTDEHPTVDITRALAAATPKADANPVAAWQAAKDALTKVLGDDLTFPTDWKSIIDGFATEHAQLGLMVLVPHVDKDRTGQFVLDLGSEPRLGVHDVAIQLALRSDRPIVLLLGCVTGPSESPTEEFPGRFLDAGASAVLATMTMVRGRFVADIARAVVVDLLKNIADHNSARLGDAVLRVRQTLLATNPLVLTLVAYGDADWTLIDSRHAGG